MSNENAISRRTIGLIAALAAVIALAALISPASAGVSFVGIGSATVATGANATVALSAVAAADDGTANGGPGDGIGAWGVQVAFDSAHLTYLSCTVITADVSFCDNPSPGLVRLTAVSLSGLTGALELGTVTFATGPTLGTYPLDATITILTDPTGTDIPGVSAGDGSITITQPTPSPTPGPSPTPSPTPTPGPSPSPTPAPRKWGDVNCDGTVNAVDALAILRWVAVLPVSQVPPCPTIGAYP